LGDSSLIAVRGDQTRANAGHILILINGRPVREILEGGVSSDILESFPINILERIEVVKGPGSVLYGSDAFSGVINLITKKAEGEDFGVSAAGGAAGERSRDREDSSSRKAAECCRGRPIPQLAALGYHGTRGGCFGQSNRRRCHAAERRNSADTSVSTTRA
jgi:outer membrane cobalamin receptor